VSVVLELIRYSAIIIVAAHIIFFLALVLGIALDKFTSFISRRPS
jgi:hypothetical protein